MNKYLIMLGVGFVLYPLGFPDIAFAQEVVAEEAADPKWLVIALMAIPIIASVINAVFPNGGAIMAIVQKLALAVGRARVDPNAQ